MLINNICLLEKFISKSSLIIKEINCKLKIRTDYIDYKTENKDYCLENFSQELNYLQTLVFAIYFIRASEEKTNLIKLFELVKVSSSQGQENKKLIKESLEQVALMNEQERIELAIDCIKRISLIEAKFLEDVIAA